VVVVVDRGLEEPEGVAGTVVVIEVVRVEDRVRGQTVVETAVIAVTTWVDRAGHSVTDSAQLRIVTSEVSYTVEVKTAGTISRTTTADVTVALYSAEPVSNYSR
jgi:hypothetical protein